MESEMGKTALLFLLQKTYSISRKTFIDQRSSFGICSSASENGLPWKIQYFQKFRTISIFWSLICTVVCTPIKSNQFFAIKNVVCTGSLTHTHRSLWEIQDGQCIPAFQIVAFITKKSWVLSKKMVSCFNNLKKDRLPMV